MLKGKAVPSEKVSPGNLKLRGFKITCLGNLCCPSPVILLSQGLLLKVVGKPFSQQWKVGHCWAL